MNSTSDKNLKYFSKIKRISKFIENNFYLDYRETEDGFSVSIEDSHGIKEDMRCKAEKIYNFFSSEKKSIDFLKCFLILNPKKGKEFLDSM